ncbi:hypothetical protein UFOVP235_41 [uncultured Caudovirales phage]|uniref:Uncharacterized protein n=1 Tax=uncultured Caudovirales phage TaxID=2100421 RepID=A0A6J7WRI1_9CAUD|nr:hypothetical protein UFOVP235_41 [uncultured Caudovirales phage]
MTNSFTLDGVEYAFDALPPDAAVMVDALMEIARRSEPMQRELTILNVARDSLIENLRKTMAATHVASTEAH